jgi:histidine phosphotransfer protein HptB
VRANGVNEMTEPTIDQAIFAELQDTAGAEFTAELTATFMEEAPTMLTELRSAQAAGDADTFRRAAHSLKSNSMTFGATRLAAMARALEQGGLISDMGPLLDIEHEYRCVADALTELTRG